MPPGTRWLMIVNVGVYFLLQIFPRIPVEYLGLVPMDVIRHYRIWEVVTYAFIHGGGMHLFLNMFALWMVGPPIESVWGTVPYLRFYFLCAIGAAVAQTLIAPNVMVVGASGAIYGLLAAFAVVFPDAIGLLFFLLPLRAAHAVLFIGIMTLIPWLTSGASHVAYLAHLGGLATGYVLLKGPVWRDQLRLVLARRRFERPVGRRTVVRRVDDLSTEIDRILEKISAHGLESLTPEEHRTLERRAGEKR